MKISLLLIVNLIIALQVYSQNSEGLEIYLDYWHNVDSQFKNPETSPLKESDLADFDSVPRFPFNPEFRVEAIFIPAKRAKPFKMEMTGKNTQNYVKHGDLKFELAGDTLILTAYRNLDLERTRPGTEFIFIPFLDETNGFSTYGGGRYLDFEKVDGSDTYILDFNKAYNPYCAYNYSYTCPIPPLENTLKVPIQAGAIFSGD